MCALLFIIWWSVFQIAVKMRILIVVVLLLVVLTVVFASRGHVRRGNKWGSGQGKHISRSRNGRPSRDSRDGHDGPDSNYPRRPRPDYPSRSHRSHPSRSRRSHSSLLRRSHPSRSRRSHPSRSGRSRPSRSHQPYNPNHWINSQYTRPRNSYEKFPKRFKFGASTNAYGIEGGYNATGAGFDVWDNATNQYPQLITDGSNGNVASDSYTFWRKDVQVAKKLGLDFYILGVSWVRILPNPKQKEPNAEAVKYYSDLIKALSEKGVEPVLQLTQFNDPEILARYGGYTNPCVIDDFVHYAETVFRLFGDRVKAWVTFDQANDMCNEYYGNGNLDPVIKVWPGVTEYLCYKNVLLAHARAYRVYKEKFSRYGGKVGIGLYTRGLFKNPENGTDEDVQKAWDFDTGFIGYPIFSNTRDCGNWNPTVVAAIDELSSAEGLYQSRLPSLTHKEQKEICGSADFVACTYFTSRYVRSTANPAPYTATSSFYTPDAGMEYTTDPSWPTGGVSWFYSYAPGMGFVLEQMKDKLGNPDVIVVNGLSSTCEIHDIDRITYLHDHLEYVLKAVRSGSNVCGYSVYAMIDGFEDRAGYTVCTGLYSVNFQSPEKDRTARDSANWYRNVIENHVIEPIPT